MKPKKTHEFVLHGLCPFEGHQAGARTFRLRRRVSREKPVVGVVRVRFFITLDHQPLTAFTMALDLV